MLSSFQACRYCRRRIETPAKMTGRRRLPVYSRLITGGLAIPVAVVVPTMMPTGVMVISAMVVPVPPASRLGLVREEYAAEQKCHERTNDDFHGLYLRLK
jgi:hypothetical protein